MLSAHSTQRTWPLRRGPAAKGTKVKPYHYFMNPRKGTCRSRAHSPSELVRRRVTDVGAPAIQGSLHIVWKLAVEGYALPRGGVDEANALGV